MGLVQVPAFATTGEVRPGRQSQHEGRLQIREQGFVDWVESDDERLSGLNRLSLDLDMDPATGNGSVRGSFVFTASSGDGTWEGELVGRIEAGLVHSVGFARGTGAFAGSAVSLAWQQVGGHPSNPPCESPSAFFEMQATMLD